MKRFRKIYILLGILAVVCIATIGVMQIEEHKEKIKNTDEIILSLPIDSIHSLSWESESEAFAFHKDENWLYDEDENFPVEEEEINRMLEQFQEFGASFKIEDVEDYGQYGLDKPICTIHLGTEEQSYDILLGGYSSMDSQRYVSIGDGNVYLVKDDPLDYFDVTIRDMVDNDEVPSFGEVTDIQFSGVESYNIKYVEDSEDTYCADDVYFIKRNEKNLPLDTSKVESYLRNISGLNLTDYVTYNVTETELASYGLDEPELTVNIEYLSIDENEEQSSDLFMLCVSRSPEDKASEQENSEEDSDLEEKDTIAYVRVGESQIVYQISPADYKNLMAASYDSLRHSEVFSADTSDIRQIDIVLEEVVYSITSEENDGERVYYYQEKEVEMANLKSSLRSLNAVCFTEEQPTQKEEIKLTIYLDNQNFPEVVVELYRYDGNNCLAVVDGNPISLVQRSDVVEVIETVYEIVLNKESVGESS